MHITVIRSGGFAGLARQGTIDTRGGLRDDRRGDTNVTADAADTADAAGLEALVHQALAESSPAPPAGIPDGFGYEIRVDGRRVYCADPHLTEAQRTLIAQVLREGA